jgi:GNAT superfamily N-acetyltransferase
MDAAHEPSGALPTWRLRVELNDRPGTLAKLATSLAARDCNILALTVLPVPDGVIDDLIVSTPEGLRPAELVTLVRSVGGRCAGIAMAEMTDLTDAPTAALRVATKLVDRSAGYAESVRDLLDADAVEPADPTTGDASAASGGRQVTVRAADDTDLVLRRGWAPFTEVELARSAALADLVRAMGDPSIGASAVVTPDGAGIVLRDSLPSDNDAVSAMHDRCSRSTLFARYHAGTRSIPRRLLNRLLAPPRGGTVVGVMGHQVVAVGQLINTNDPAVGEVSLLVEDDWQGQGIGAALLTHLVRSARAAGHTELFGWCLPDERGLVKAARRAGFTVSTRYEEDLLRVSLDTRTDTGAEPEADLADQSPLAGSNNPRS